MATLTELIEIKRDFESKMGNRRQDPELRDDVSQLNHALRQFGVYLQMFSPSILFAPRAGVGEYQLQQDSGVYRRVIKPHIVVVAGRPLMALDGRPGFLTIQELERYRPDWRTCGQGTPEVATYVAPNRLSIFPAPNAETVQKNGHSIAGTYLPGVIYGNGNYDRDGFRIPSLFLGGDGPRARGAGADTSAITGTSTSASVATASGSDLWTIVGDVTAHGAVSAVDSAYIQADGGPTPGEMVLSDFDFAIPAGAVITDAYMSYSLPSGWAPSSGTTSTMQRKTSLTVNDSNIAGTTVLEASHTLDRTAFQVEALTPEIVNDSTFGVRIEWNIPTGPYRVDRIRLHLAYYVPADVDHLAAQPDLPVELHEALAYYASVHNALVNIGNKEVYNVIQAINPVWAEHLRAYRRDNVQMASSARGRQFGRKWPDVVRLY